MKDLESLKALIKEHVTLGELLKQANRITYSLEEEQFACPFHGADRKKSARYYKNTDTAYCWVCKEKWDVFSYTRKVEGIGFHETITHLVKEYRIDISRLPESTEENVRKLQDRTVPKIDNKKLSIEKIRQAIHALKEEVGYDIYLKLVYSYMLLKYLVPDESFEDQCKKLKDGMFRVINRLKNEKEKICRQG